MAIVYLEELVERVQNKYLAVNVIAKRARSLNDELLGAGLSQKQKPVTVATEELAEGKLSYQKLDPETTESDSQSLFASESGGYDEVEEENPLAEIYGENASDEDEKEQSESETDETQTETEDKSDESSE